MKDFRKSDFDRCLNTIFEVHPEGKNTVTIELVETSEKKGERIESFSLLFRGSPENVFGHDTHTLTHPAFGEFQMFIGPVMNPKINGACYQAVFSRVK